MKELILRFHFMDKYCKRSTIMYKVDSTNTTIPKQDSRCKHTCNNLNLRLCARSTHVHKIYRLKQSDSAQNQWGFAETEIKVPLESQCLRKLYVHEVWERLIWAINWCEKCQNI